MEAFEECVQPLSHRRLQLERRLVVVKGRAERIEGWTFAGFRCSKAAIDGTYSSTRGTSPPTQSRCECQRASVQQCRRLESSARTPCRRYSRAPKERLRLCLQSSQTVRQAQTSTSRNLILGPQRLFDRDKEEASGQPVRSNSASRNASPSRASSSPDAATGRQVETARAISWISGVNDSMVTWPP